MKVNVNVKVVRSGKRGDGEMGRIGRMGPIKMRKVEERPRRKGLRRGGGAEHAFRCLMTNRKRCDAAGSRVRMGPLMIPTPKKPSPVAPEGVRPALA